MPRRGRETVAVKHPLKAHTLLLGRLRNLETMIADLGTEVEHAVGEAEGEGGADGWPSDARQSDSNQENKGPGSQSGSSTAGAASHSLRTSADTQSVVVADDGNLVVRDRFWTVFCNEV